MSTVYIPDKYSYRCKNYDLHDKPAIEILRDVKSFEKNSTHTFIAYILSGEITLSYDTVKDYSLSQGDLMLFRPGACIYGKVMYTVNTLIFRINDHISLCDNYTIENLYRDCDITKLKHTHLAGNSIINAFMTELAKNLDNGLRCINFMKIKLRELFYYLRAYYPKDLLACFNLPLLNPDSVFMDQVWSNYRMAHNIDDLAQMLQFSRSKLDKKIRQITGISAYKWLIDQKAQSIHHDLCYGRKTMKEISAEHNLSSISHLVTFCRKYLGATPKEIITQNGQKPATPRFVVRK
jgi:AraC-like DNA-binding protein